MKRREFICLLGGAVAVWPLVVRAQQPGQLRRVGMLIGYAENDTETQARLVAFRQGLEHLGWTEGRNIRIDYRFAPAGPDQAQHCAKELVALRPDILVGNSTPATAALLLETHTVPIVFVGEWLRREHRAAGRQHHRFHQFRAVADRKVARAAQANRARHRARLLAVRHALPAIYPYRYEAADGGLLSYGVDTVDLLRRAAPYVDRILKGEKRPIFPCRRRPSSSWSSICGPPRRSGSRSRRLCSRSPMR